MSQQMVTLGLVTKSDLGWSAAYDILSKVVLDHGDEFAYTSLSTTDMDDPVEDENEEPELYHDEETLVKVHETIAAIVGDAYAKDILNDLQNAGILFRERVS